MPPVKTLSVKGTISQGRHDEKRELLKPYSKETSTGSPSKKTKFYDDYMSLDEFFQKTSNDNECETIEDNDYPRPNGNLLASLYTLGNLIQNQKKLIQCQQQKNLVTTSTSKSSIVPTDNQAAMLNEITHSEDSGTTHSHARPESCYSSDINPQQNSEPSSKLLPDLSTTTKNPENVTQSLPSVPNVVSSSKGHIIPDSYKDVDYWNKRKRNNSAAKKSREERRNRELKVFSEARQLEKENSQLTTILKRLTERNELLESRLQEVRKRSWQGESSGTSTSSEET
ncbi:thyrotroph embryonic factor-like [Hydractinia symbiolongicarpus]|uniref:thyrotroph embryonic factor-like n=1 Tax=Hydractinia symbiolongicarpus TaxID=13093 RepID=UPI00254FDE8C|nr:thyrotroph embryonic factor-like [Hydractinia symbiolongicarpus]